MSQLTEREQGGNTDEGKSGLGEDRLVDIVDDPALKVQSCSSPVLPRTEPCTPDPTKSNPPNLSEAENYILQTLEEKMNRTIEILLLKQIRESMQGLSGNMQNVKKDFDNIKGLNEEQQKIISELEEKLNEVNEDQQKIISKLEEKLNEVNENQQKIISKLEEKLNEVNENQQKRITQLEEKLNEVNENQQKRITQLEEKLRDDERNLWLYDLPEQEAENLKARVIAICTDIVQWPAGEFHHHIDIVHRVGKRSEVKHRPVIIRFIVRSTRDLLWETYKRSEHHLSRGVKFAEELTAKDKDTRVRLWPLIEAARKEGKKAFFVGAKVIIDGKEISE